MKRLVFIVLLIGFGLSGRSATINVSNYFSLSNAICATAAEGDTIQIGAVDITISNLIFCSRGISFTIAGSGTNQTTLRSKGMNVPIWITTTSTNVFVVRDFNFIGASGDNFGIKLGGTGASAAGYFHVYNIKMTNIFGRGLSVGGGLSSFGGCLVDHCTFGATASGWLQNLDFNGADYGSWTNGVFLGTTNVSCVEDCYFYTPSGQTGNGHFDAYRGARILFRHNVVDGYAPIGGHGYDSQIDSIQSWEIYNNRFTNWNGSALAVWRGGTGVMFSNSISGSGVTLLAALGYYRTDPISFYNTLSPAGYLPQGLPGTNYVINFTHYNQPPGQGFPTAGYTNGSDQFLGYDPFPSGNATNGQLLLLGSTRYYFVTNLANATFQMNNDSGYGGGAVLVGATAAQTITNWLNAINLGPGYGVTRTNWNDPTGSGYLLGHDFVAATCDTTNLYLRNALDSTNTLGYPANQQQGVLTSFPLSSSNFVNAQTVWTAWFGSNTLNGALFNVAEPVYSSGYTQYNLCKMGRDITNGIPPVNVYSMLVYPHPLQSQESGSAVISAVPTSLDFGTLLTNTSTSLTFYVTNSGSAVLASGSATVGGLPYTLANADYSGLAPNAAQTVTVTFTPTSAGTFNDTVTCTGGGGATVTLTGSATNAPLPAPIRATTLTGKVTITGNVTLK